jgi:hypothetical protein
MATENNFPKADGDVLYGSEVNGLDSLNILSNIAQVEVACSDTNDSTTVANATVWILKNTGANNVYINFGADAATTNFYLKPNEEIQFQLQQTELNYICAAGLTSTLSIIAGVGAWKRYSNFLSTTIEVEDSTTAIYNDATSYSNWLISNDGANDMCVRFSATAVTTDYRIKVGETLSINYPSIRLDGITISATHSVARVWAVG